MTLHPVSYYAHELRPHLGAEVFAPAPARLAWLALHVAVVVAGIWAIAAGGLAWPLQALISIPIGLAFAGMAFVAHEALHGAVVRPRWARLLVGGIGFAPYLISARHWVAWHNRMHHGHTGVAGSDPDMYPTLEGYRANRFARLTERLSFGGRRLLGVVSLLIGLVVQSLEVLLSLGPRSGYLTPRQHRLAIAETVAAAALWVGLGWWLGAGVFVFGWLIPLGIGSAVVMGYIVTNHGLSSLTEVNDPLANSLSVTVPGWFSTYSLQFGLHVEHHLFPSVSARHAPRIRDLIQERWPERYRSLPLGSALARMFTSGRVYKDRETLIDPVTGAETPTL
jgi:fatty acid desaturase